MQEITYRVHANNWCYEQPGYLPPTEHTVIGSMGPTDAIGRLDITVKGTREKINVHWSDISRYYPYENGREYF